MKSKYNDVNKNMIPLNKIMTEMAQKSREVDGKLNLEEICLSLHESTEKLYRSARKKNIKRKKKEIQMRTANIFIGGLIAANILKIKDVEKIILKRTEELKAQE